MPAIRLSRDQLRPYLRRRPGLLVGPAQTLYPGAIKDFLQTLGIPYPEVPVSLGVVVPADAQTRLKTFLAPLKAGVGCGELAKINWSAILSFTPDHFFEDEFRAAQEKRATRGIPTVLEPPSLTAPPRSIPVFKLTGSAANQSYAISRSAHARLRGVWPQAARVFADELKGAPIICSGLQDCLTSVLDLLAAMLSASQGVPSPWILLRDDPVANSKEFAEATEGITTIAITDLTLGEMVRAIDETRIARPTVAVPASSVQWPFLNLVRFSHVATPINHFTVVAPGPATSKTRLLDMLFTSHSTDFEPFKHDLDLKRSITAQVVIDAKQAAAEDESRAMVLTGSAVTGKTLLLKRVGFDLARDGFFTIWLTPPFGPDSHLPLRDLVDQIAAARPNKATPAIFIADDVLSFASGALRAIVLQAAQHDLKVLLLTSCRTSEWQTTDASVFTSGLPMAVKYDLDDKLDDLEFKQLPGYLTKIQAATDLTHAEKLVNNAYSRHARDILGIFYVLLPSSRAAIKLSIQDEYFRLGDLSYVAEHLLSAAAGSVLLRKAYEYVAVSCYHRTPVPIEVLVSVLGVSYDKWMNETQTHSAVWGVLYSVEDDEEENSERYRTRVEVVDDVIVAVVNGSTISRAAETNRIRELLNACTGSQQLYRDYCIRILVRNPTLKAMNFEEGLQLFDAAIAALPFPDKTLQHHRALWIKNAGGTPLKALEELSTALKTPNYPNIPKPEMDEHIYTSMAATVLDAIKLGQKSVDDGKREVMQHLDRASTSRFMNLNAIHVRASLVVELLSRVKADNASDVVTLANNALATVEGTLSMMDIGDARAERREELEALYDVRGKIFTRLHAVDTLREWATRLWEDARDQGGFVLVARRLLENARQDKKGYKQAYDYADDALRIVASAGLNASRELLRIAMIILYEWRVRRPQGSDLSLVWKDLESLYIRLLQVAGTQDDPHASYIGAIALCHLDKWGDARSHFGKARAAQIPNEIKFAHRDSLMNANGTTRRVQGVIRRGGSDNFLQVADLHEDFHLSRADAWPPVGSSVNATLAFSYAGPTARRELG